MTSRISNFQLHNEDCIDTCRRLKHSSVDLIYADPPFFTGRDFDINGHGFSDKWEDIDDYLNWLKPRLKAFKRVLKSTGSIYIHCDWHSSHYIKVLMDRYFGLNNFVNEIIWKRQSAHNDSKQGSKHFGRIHDTIFLYSASKDYCWNQQFTPYDYAYVEKTYKYTETLTKRRFAVGDLTGPGGAMKGNPSYEFMGISRYWRYSKTTMFRLLSEGRISHKEGRVPLLKRYLDEMNGKPLQDIWIDIKTSRGKDAAFPTAKPEALLNRIITVSSNPDNLVYDPFTGSGISAICCFKLKRNWIGSEMSQKNYQYTLNRLVEEQANSSRRENKRTGKSESSNNYKEYASAK